MCSAITGENGVEVPDRGARPLRIRPDRADDGEKIRAGLDQGRAIFLGDAANRDAGHDRRLRPVAQYLGAGAMLRRLGAAREKRAEGDVVGADLGSDDGAVPAIAAGHPDDAVRAQKPARLVIWRILLADMHAIAIELGGEI